MRPQDHPFRQWAVDEMRLRRFAPVPDRCEIYQAVRLIDPDDRGQEDEYLLGEKPAFGEWSQGKRFAMGKTNTGIHFIWERHTEASTITIIVPHDCPKEECSVYVGWSHGWPGLVIRATRIQIIPDPANIDQYLAQQEIGQAEMVCCDINSGLRIWSDFDIHPDGYGRLIVSAGEVNDHERGRIVQRAQELGNYRNMALLGLPTVQQQSPALDALEQALSDHATRVSLAKDGEEDDDLLQQLATISSQLELIRSATEFRLSATKAYADIATDRLQALDIRPVANYQSLTDYTERRLVPAARTCAVFYGRLARIAERISRVMHTLDVRIDTRIKAQNLRLTKSMERSIQLQLRLQRLVEGLSVIAAAYYLVGLIGFIVQGVIAYPDGSQIDIILAACTLPVIAAIYFFVLRLRGTMSKSEDA